MLTLDNVAKYYGGLAALDGVSLQVQAGDLVGIIGPNGAGKTTLFSLISGTATASRGRVLFMGRDITSLRPDAICRRGVGRTFQVVRPFQSLTVRQHLQAAAWFGGAGQVDKAAMESLLQLTQLAPLAEQPASRLTLAGCKRLEIARALATGARLLLLDETMAGLSPEETREAVALVRRIREGGCTVLLIEHVLPAVTDLCDRVLVLDHGEAIADGPPREVLALESVRRAYLGE